MQNIEQQMKSCTLCPRSCKVNRTQGQLGVCGQSAEIKVARADLHMWEEPCISGENGSGAVFFSGCALHCVFCQNHNIAAGNAGKEITVERLAQIFMELQEKGANNINLVTAGQFIPQIVKAIGLARKNGLLLPIVYNTSAYEEVETLRMLEGYVDIYLPDLKYVDNKLSEKYSYASDYFARASAAIEEMVRQVGEPEFVRERCAERKKEPTKEHETPERERRFGVAEYQERSQQEESLIMTRGVIVRHLLLPGCVEDSKAVLEYLLSTYGERIFISIMNQYTPLPHVNAYPELTRRVTEEEYEEIIEFAIAHGIENGFIQEGGAAEESFIPEFDGKGV